MDGPGPSPERVLWRCLEAMAGQPEVQASTMESLTLGATHSREARAMLWAIFSVLRPGHILETGTSHGLTSAFMWALAEDLGRRPTLLTFDVAASALSPSVWRHLGATESITFVQGDSATMIPRMCRNAIEFALIDGDHTYAGAERDWQAIRPLLASRSVVLLDNMRHIDGCGRFFAQLDPLWFHPEMAMVMQGLSDTESQAMFSGYLALEMPPWVEAIPGDRSGEIRERLRAVLRLVEQPLPDPARRQVADLCREISALAAKARFPRGSHVLRISTRYNIGSVAEARRQRLIEAIPQWARPWMMRGYRFVKRGLCGQ